MVEKSNDYNLLGERMNLSELVESLGATEFKARLVAELDGLVEQNPDFVYITQDQFDKSGLDPKCSYDSGPQLNTGRSETHFGAYQYVPFEDNTDQQNKGCIFGQALRAMGVDLSGNDSGIEFILTPLLGIQFARPCRGIQCRQDSGEKWGNLNVRSLDGL
jgi:hypothetical protein